jgi:hypothetical protein
MRVVQMSWTLMVPGLDLEDELHSDGEKKGILVMKDRRTARRG